MRKILLVAVILMIAGLADMKYKGLFYRLLPESVQSYIDHIFA